MTQKNQKIFNQTRILNYLQFNRSSSQVEIAEETGLQTSTVSYLIRELKKSGVIISSGKSESGALGGKKRDILTLNADFGCFGGFYLKNNFLTYHLVDFCGNISHSGKEDISILPEKEIQNLLNDLIVQQKEENKNYLGAGIAVSSIVNNEGDIVESSHFSKTVPRVLTTIKQPLPGIHIIVENDANCAVFYDYFAEAGKYKNLIHLLINNNPFTIGAGIIKNNGLYKGNNGGAGELPDFLFSGDNNYSSLEKVIDFASSFLDPELIIVSGSTAKMDEDLINKLKTNKNNSKIKVSKNEFTPILGASLRTSNVYIQSILEEGL